LNFARDLGVVWLAGAAHAEGKKEGEKREETNREVFFIVTPMLALTEGARPSQFRC
jgi:hypothetical protein